MRLKNFLFLRAFLLPFISLAEPSKPCYECHEGKKIQEMESNLASFEVLKDLSKDVKTNLKANVAIDTSKASGVDLLRVDSKPFGKELLLTHKYSKGPKRLDIGRSEPDILYASCLSAGLNKYEKFPEPKITGGKIFNKRATYHYLN